MWERVGKAERARELYQASLERLPSYAPATAHLAALEAAGVTVLDTPSDVGEALKSRLGH